MNFLPDFSHIYVESQSIDSDIAEQSFKRFPKAKIIEIEDYKKIFNKNGQDFQIQKLSTKLILAKKQPLFIYPATDIIQDSGFSNFYYCTPILNCIYNCEYCFLQGMYSSANIVVFTNTEEVKDAVKNKFLNASIQMSHYYYRYLIIPIFWPWRISYLSLSNGSILQTIRMIFSWRSELKVD